MTAQEKLDSKTVLDTNPATGTAVAELNETDLAKLPEIMAKAREARRSGQPNHSRNGLAISHDA